MKNSLTIKRIDKTPIIIFELYLNKEWVGKVCFNKSNIYDFNINDLMVCKKHTRKGYAKLLMNILLAEFGNRNIRLLAEGDDNNCPTKELVKFYRKLGFRGYKKEEYGGVYMERPEGMPKVYRF